ncbi:MAG: hypothetical protein KKA73_10775 [Chloroflexi bacterium]|nr:hypothetical protein [Chloroflexota bacterium]MBU1748161.1 hypothetical protein [Chloroflexota bacterium]MBU1879447.1 hypothetical protein [Chloroflexota bacterium]
MNEPALDSFLIFIDRWLLFLDREGKASVSVATYARDLRQFAAWLETSYGQSCKPAAVNSTPVSYPHSGPNML